MAKSTLSYKQQRFVAEYLVDLNPAAAYMRAGYKATHHSADTAAWRLLKKVGVQNALKEANKKLAQKLEVSAERTLREIGRIAYSDVRKLFDDAGNLKHPKDWDDDTAAAVKGVEFEEITHGVGPDSKVIGTLKKVRLWNKDQELDRLAKRFRLYDDDEARGNLYIILQQVLQMTPQQLEEEARRVVSDVTQQPEPIATSVVPVSGSPPSENGTAGNGVCH